MARTKFAHARYLLINRELIKKRWVRAADLKKCIESHLGMNISLRQVEKDLEAMKSDSLLGYYAPIEYSKRLKSFRYTEADYSIEKFNLKEEEIRALKFYAASLNQYREHGIFRDFSSALTKVVNAVSLKNRLSFETSSRLIIHPDNAGDPNGAEFLGLIASAIENRIQIEFIYRKFDERNNTLRVCNPFLLKEYRNRWYLIGTENEEDFIKTFALDRMSNVTDTNNPITPCPSFDPELYFRHSFGITTDNYSKPCKVVLHFSKDQSGYVRTLKVHATQRIIADNERGLRIEINVLPSYELYEFILSKGSGVKVVAPRSMANKIKEWHKSAAKLYNKPRGKKIEHANFQFATGSYPCHIIIKNKKS